MAAGATIASDEPLRVDEESLLQPSTPSKNYESLPFISQLSLSENSDSSVSHNQDDLPIKTSYYEFFRDCHDYRGFLASFIVTNVTEWLNYVASIALLERHAGDSAHSKLLLSLLIVVRLIPLTLLCPLGGVLADSLERRHLMIGLDMTGALVALMFLGAHYMGSILLLFIATFFQTVIIAFYEPTRSAILPQMVPPHYLPKATTISTWTWSVVQALGSSAGGLIVHTLGIPACFLIDSAGFVVSAALMYFGATGSYHPTRDGGPANSVSEDEGEGGRDSSSSKTSSQQLSTFEMLQQVWNYIVGSSNGIWVLSKACACITSGALDVLIVGFATVDGSLDASRLGILFAMIGVGAMIGPLFQQFLPETIRSWYWSGASAMLVISLGIGGLGFSSSFATLCFWTVIRACGHSIVYISASLILQTTTPQEIMGRVSSVDFCASTFVEAASVIAAGALEDRGMSPEGVSKTLCIFMLGVATMWLSYVYRNVPEKER